MDHKIIEFIEGKRGFYAIVARLTRPLKHRLSGLRYRRVVEDVETRMYIPVGCSLCDDTGYQGRIGIYEVLVAGRGDLFRDPRRC